MVRTKIYAKKSLLWLILRPIAINDLFTTWYNALQYAANEALSIVQQVINEVDLPQNTNFILRDILFALTVGLAYIAGPGTGGLTGLIFATAFAGKAFLRGANQAPTVARGMWPAGTESSIMIQIGDIESELNSALGNTSTMFNSGLELLMSDMPAFVDFASTGMFSGSQDLSLPKEVDGLDIALRTFIVSNAMSSNGWHASVAVDVTRDDIASNVAGSGGSDCSWHGPNDEFCGDYIWYSDATMRAFTLTGTQNLNGTMQLLNDILTSEWSTLPMLFDGAYNCTVAGFHGGPPVQIEPNGELNMFCMSQLTICIACGEQCPIPLVNGSCPFVPCGGSCSS